MVDDELEEGRDANTRVTIAKSGSTQFGPSRMPTSYMSFLTCLRIVNNTKIYEQIEYPISRKVNYDIYLRCIILLYIESTDYALFIHTSLSLMEK